jgi:photosystem II stability/assembly factor-like uncharacterized protein
MKISSVFLVFCALVFTNCQKFNANTDEADATNIKTAPFENSQFKIERASTSLPEATTKIHFFDESNGICLTGGKIYNTMDVENAHTAGGSLYTTNNGGLTWTLSYLFSKASSNCLRPMGFEVMNDKTIVAFAGGSQCSSTDADVRTNVVIRSTDKGKTWTTNAITNTQLWAMSSGDDNTYLVGRFSTNGEMHGANTILGSKDGGLSWKSTALNSPLGRITKIMNLTPKKMMIRGGYFDATNLKLESTDNGVNWEKNTGNEFVLDVSHGEKMGLYLSTERENYQFTVYETHNSGDSWSTIRKTGNTTNEVKVLSATTALILGRSAGEETAGFSYTLDGGKTWTDKALFDNGNAGELIASSFYSPKSGYIVGAKNVLYKMTFKQ